jgi:hypothetical protein
MQRCRKSLSLHPGRFWPNGFRPTERVTGAVLDRLWTYNLSDVASVLGTWLLPLLPLVLNQTVS